MKVTLIESMGSDLSVANAARRSFGAEYQTFRSRADGARGVRGRSDEELLDDLVRDGHMLPFRHPHVTLSCDSPIPVARQLGKHQTGLSWSEISRRYKTRDIVFYQIDGRWRSNVKDRRQGSGGLLPDLIQNDLDLIQRRNISSCMKDYAEALELGASPEQARLLLPQSMEVSWTWTGSLLAWAHLYHQRTHPDAQAETREFAEAVGEIMAGLYPYAWRALTSKATG